MQGIPTSEVEGNPMKIISSEIACNVKIHIK